MREIDSKEYWRRREEEALKHYIKEEAAYDREIRRIYQNQLDSIQTQINSFYGKYATKEGITIAEAKKRVSKLDIAEYERKAARYVKEKNFSDRANEEMRIYNLTMKVNRLEMLKANIGLELISGHDELNRFMEKILRGRTEAELKRQAGILGHTIRDNAKLAHTIPNASFHNATFSDRIWMHQDIMKADLSKLLQTGLIQGKNPRELARSLRKYYCGDKRLKNGRSGAIYNTERLMRTEMARVQTEAQKQSFVENGFKQYMFIANTNSGCCDECRNNDGKVFDVAKMTIGDNAPPIHPHCRCSIAAYSGREDFNEMTDYINKDRTTKQQNEHNRPLWEHSKKKRIKERAVEKSAEGDIIKSDLTEDDIEAILGYMSAKSYNINEKLRSEEALSAEDQSFVNDLDYVLEKMPVYKGDLTRSLYFYSDADIALFMKSYEVGRQITYHEYISTTKGKEHNPNGQVQIIIRDSKHGKDISSLNGKEQEVLYPRGSTFNVIDIKVIDGKYYIYLEEA